MAASKKNITPKKYTEEAKANARRAYESGALNLKEVGLAQKIPYNTVLSWYEKGNWQKNALQAKTYESVVERNTRLFMEAGCTPAKVAKVMSEVINETAAMLRDICRELKAAGIEGDTYTNLVEMIKGYSGSKRDGLAYIQEYNRMIGNLAPQKREVTGKDGGPITFSGAFKAMNDEELLQVADKYFKKFAMLTGKEIPRMVEAVQITDEKDEAWKDLL